MSTTIDSKPTALELTPRQAITPMDLIHMAVSEGADLDKLERLLQLKREWEADEAKKAYVAAMAAFKCEPISVIKDKENKQYSSKEVGGSKAMYTSLGNMVSTVTPFLSKHGLSARWDVDQAAGIKVTCIMTHAQGHSEQVSMTLPVDTSGAKNPIQGIKSSITYAKATTYESICGLASTDANLDDDGNGFQAPSGIAEERFVEQCEWIKAARTPQELFDIHKAAHVEAQKVKDSTALRGYMKAKEARKAELAKEVL